MKRLLATGLLALSITTLFTFSGGYACAKELVPIVTPGAGGTAYVMGAGIGSIARKYLPDTGVGQAARAELKALNKPVDK